jgi:hypothetical protein
LYSGLHGCLQFQCILYLTLITKSNIVNNIMMVIKHTVCLITSSRNLMRISGTIIVLTARLSAVASSVGLSCTVPEVWLYSSVQFCAPRRVGSLLCWPAYCLASPPRARRAGSLLRWPANCLAPPCRYDSSYSTGIIYQL